MRLQSIESAIGSKHKVDASYLPPVRIERNSSKMTETRGCRWSIEGAIGSKHKVDASYLSPNVNMAARLETATKQYGVSILMSADFTALLSPKMRARCRQIDTVLVKGSSQPMGIWTIDTDTRFIESDSLEPHDDEARFVHDTQTPWSVPGGEEDEFDLHPDAQNSYAVNAAFLEVWRLSLIHI